mmetsp:Transcript_60984/g.188878  ORF Transcript_60984/g.188878 Transcript_60984/m.188878 type:complete len:314 (+) Transcript_60984:365-1306(+)
MEAYGVFHKHGASTADTDRPSSLADGKIQVSLVGIPVLPVGGLLNNVVDLAQDPLVQDVEPQPLLQRPDVAPHLSVVRHLLLAERLLLLLLGLVGQLLLPGLEGLPGPRPDEIALVHELGIDLIDLLLGGLRHGILRRHVRLPRGGSRGRVLRVRVTLVAGLRGGSCLHARILQSESLLSSASGGAALRVPSRSSSASCGSSASESSLSSSSSAAAPPSRGAPSSSSSSASLSSASLSNICCCCVWWRFSNMSTSGFFLPSCASCSSLRNRLYLCMSVSPNRVMGSPISRRRSMISPMLSGGSASSSPKRASS